MGVMNKFWHEPERGRQGDHGQPGTDGHDGRDGRDGATPALRARMLVLYLVVIVLLVAVVVVYQRGEASSKHNDAVRDEIRNVLVQNCYDNQANTIRFNKFVDKLIATYQGSKLLTPKQKAERADFFADAKGDVPTCPPNGVK